MPGLDEIIVTDEARKRASRSPDHQAENRALRLLAAEMEKPDGDVLARLADVALELCGGHSAGISLIEGDGVETRFRWHAVSGRWAPHVGGGMPRNASPCGVVIDRNSTLLMSRPGGYFPMMAEVDPLAAEALLAPFHLLGQPVGTVWVVTHDDTHKFDAEDVRIIESLAQVASAAFLVRSEIRLALESRDEALRANERLKRANQKLSEKLGLD